MCNISGCNTTFVSQDLYEQALVVTPKKEVTKLLKMCNIKSTGSLSSQRSRLTQHIDSSIKNHTEIPEGIILHIVKALNTNGLNMELNRLGLETKGNIKTKKETLIGYLKENNVRGNPTSCMKSETSAEKCPTKEAGPNHPQKETETDNPPTSIEEREKKISILETSLLKLQNEVKAQKGVIDIILSTGSSSSKNKPEVKVSQTDGNTSPTKINCNCKKTNYNTLSDLKNEVADLKLKYEELSKKVERFQETATDSTEECEPPCYSLQVQNERIRRLERSVSGILRSCDPGDRCHYNAIHFEHNYARCKKQYPQYVDTNTLTKNYTENLFDESVEVVIPFITECEVKSTNLPTKNRNNSKLPEGETRRSAGMTNNNIAPITATKEEDWTLVKRNERRKQPKPARNEATLEPSRQVSHYEALPKKNINIKHKCCLIYDSHFDNFRNDFFTRIFDVEVVKMKSLNHIKILEDRKIQKKFSGCEVIYLHLGNVDAKDANTTCQRILQNIGKVLSFLIRNTSAKICLSTPMRNKLNRNIDAKLAEIENEIYGIPQLYSVKRISIVNIYGIKSFVDETVSKQKLTLTRHGERRLYLKLKDSLTSTLGYQLNATYSVNKSSYRLRIPNYTTKTPHNQDFNTISKSSSNE